MGNCCKPVSSMEWGGDDWGSLVTSKNRKKKVFDEDHHELMSLNKEKHLGDLRTSGKVKIRITKRELEVLLGEMEKQKQKQQKKEKQGKVSAEQVLFRLMNAKEHQTHHHRPWSPVLESIPEDN